MPDFNLTSRSLSASPQGEAISRILSAALCAVEPGTTVKRWVERQSQTLVVAGCRYDLTHFRRVLLVGVGKAAVPMGNAVAQIVGDRLDQSILITKEGYGHPVDLQDRSDFTVLEASHPVPDECSVQATERLLNLLKELSWDDLVIFVVSGGGSALFTAPAPGLPLQDLRELTSTLLACGATICEINTVRKHLDTVKGGGLARRIAPATLITLILSDVVGDPLDGIASGPTAPDPSTFAEAYAVLERYRLLDQVPATIVEHLLRGMKGILGETPKPGDAVFERVQNVIVGSNQLSAEAAVEQARQEGFNTLLLTTFLEGEARSAGSFLAAIARQIAVTGQPLPRPACVIAGGETTVVVHGDGLGGRNQEVALGAVELMAGLKDVALVTLATDGGDGLTDAAGAVVTGETLNRARELGLSPVDYGVRNDSYHFFDPLGDLLKPGTTQTNVNDLAFLFAF